MIYSLKHGGGPLVAILWVAVAVADLLLRNDTAVHSASEAIAAATTAAIIMWPVTAGLAAIVTLRPLRPAMRDIVDAQPDAAKLRLIMTPLLILTGWALVGLFAAASVCVAVAGFSDSWAPWPDYLALIPVAAGTVAVGVLGGVIGLLIPSWIVGPAVAVGTYLLFLVPSSAIETMTAYIGESGDPALVPETSTVVYVTALSLALGGAAGALGIFRLTGSRRSLALFLAVGLSWGILFGVGGGQGGYRYLPESMWACTSIPVTESSICVPGEQAGNLSAAATALSDIDKKVVESFPTGAEVGYGPVARGTQLLQLPVPYGDFDAFSAEATETIASYLSYCASLGKYPDDPDADMNDPDRFNDSYGYLGYLQGSDVEIGMGEVYPALSVAEARELVLLAEQGCDAQ